MPAVQLGCICLLSFKAPAKTSRHPPSTTLKIWSNHFHSSSFFSSKVGFWWTIFETDFDVILTSLTPSRSCCLPRLQPRHPPKATWRNGSINLHSSSFIRPKLSLTLYWMSSWDPWLHQKNLLFMKTPANRSTKYNLKDFDQYSALKNILKMTFSAVSKIVPQNPRSLLVWRMMKNESGLSQFSRLFLEDVLDVILEDRMFLMESRMSGWQDDIKDSSSEPKNTFGLKNDDEWKWFDHVLQVVLGGCLDFLAGALKDRSCLMDVRIISKMVSKIVPQNQRNLLAEEWWWLKLV